MSFTPSSFGAPRVSRHRGRSVDVHSAEASRRLKMAVSADDKFLPLVQSAFRQRHEELLACESLFLSGSGGRKKPRLLALCRPFSVAATAAAMSYQATLNILQADDETVKVRLVFGVVRLVDIECSEELDATFDFGSSGKLSVTFESRIQRSIFVETVRRVQRDVQSLTALDCPSMQALLTDAVDAEATEHVMTTRHKKHFTFTDKDEQELLKVLQPGSFDDIRATASCLSMQQSTNELLLVSQLIGSADKWREVREDISGLGKSLDELEAQIAKHSRHILSRKESLQRVEHQNNTLQRKQHNLLKLEEQLRAFSGQLSLPSEMTMLLATLRMTPDDKLTKFFSENGNAPLLSRTMKLICSLLRDVKLEADFPIAAVAERRAFFAEQQRMVVDRSMTYVLTLIKHYETEYLADAARFSSSSRLVWRFHGELMDKMKCIRDLIKTIGLVDPPGFVAVLRRYRVCMQRVYAMEMNRFFKQLRARIKKVGPRGPFLLGVRDAPGDTLAYRAENASEESPTGRWEYTPTSVAHSTPANFSFSRSFSVRGGESAAGWTSGIRDQLDDEVLSVDLVNAEDERLRLYNPAHMQTEGDALLTSISVASAFSGKKGKLRPDVALAVALETTFTVILREEDVLCRCFGLAVADGEKGDRDKEADVGRAGRPSGGSETGFASMFVGDDVTMKCSNTMGLLNESLLELFGGDKLVRFPSKIPSSPSLVGGGENECSRNDATPKSSDRTRGADRNFEANEGPFNAHRCGLRKAQEQCDVRKQLVGLAEYFGEKCDRLYAVPVMAMVQAYRREDTQIGSSSFCQALLQVLEEVMASIISRSMAEQNASVLSCRRRYLVLPTGILTCFTKLPTFVQRMEIVHNDLSPAISRGEYASFGRKLVDLSFESLKCITNLSSGEGNEGVKLSTMENVARCTNRIFNKSEKSIKSLKHIFLQNYRHHAFFCAFYASLDPSCYAVEFLSERYSSSCELRDHYGELYLTRVVFRKKFPVFSHFVLVSEELAQMHSPDQLQHHSMLSKDKVQEVLQSLPEEMQSGIPSSSKKMKKHFLRDVAERKNEVSFHCELLQSVWKDFCTMLLQKFDFLEGILRWPVYAGMRTTLTRQRVMELLHSV